MTAESFYLCSRCKKRYDINNVRYDRWGKLACVKCLGEVEPPERVRIQMPDSLKMEFICVNCRFKFKVSRDSSRKLLCPYCGRTNVMQVKRYKDENDLIREASDPRYDY